MGVPGDRVGTAAVLLDVHPDLVRYGRLTNVRAYAALLDANATGDFDRGDLALWAQAVAFVSGIELEEGQAHYIHEGVYRILRRACGPSSPSSSRWMWCPTSARPAATAGVRTGAGWPEALPQHLGAPGGERRRPRDGDHPHLRGQLLGLLERLTNTRSG